MSFYRVRAPLREDVLCMEFIFHRELLVQIRETEIINERKRVQQAGERPRKGILRERDQGGGRDGADKCLLRAFPY